jgi:hypothetical protein
VAAGTRVQYTGTLTNRDSSGCEASDFRLFADLPAGWSGDSTTVNLAPGAEAPVTLGISSPVDAGEGLYHIVIHAENTADPSYGGSTMVNYRIAAPLNRAPVAVEDTVRLTAKKAIGIDVLANDNDPDGDPLAVIQISQGTQGSVQISGDGRLLYTPEKKFRGSDSFSYTCSDGENTASATVNVTLVKNKN